MRLVIILNFFVLLLSCSTDDGETIRNCRIKEMYHLYGNGQRYTFSFQYDRLGRLNKINSPNQTLTYKYSQDKLEYITITNLNGISTVKFEYPSTNLTRWKYTQSSPFPSLREYSVYHKNNLVDSLLVIDPENENQTYNEYPSWVTYNDNNVSKILTFTPCCKLEIKEIEYDNGLNPALLLMQSTGIYTGYYFRDYYFLNFTPEMLSINNVSRYAEIRSSDFTNELVREFRYTYGFTQYPIEIEEIVNGQSNGKTFFVYDNCE